MRTRKKIETDPGSVQVARRADVVVLAIGGNEQTSREGLVRRNLGDRTSLELIGRQEELARPIIATGRPVIVLLFNGRPLAIKYLSEHVLGDFRMLVFGQETATPWPTCPSAISIPAANCP